MELPTREIIQRVIPISPNENSCGTSLAYPVNGSMWLITAAHVLDDMPHEKKGQIGIFKDNQWNPVDAIPYYFTGRPYNSGDIDLAVIKTSIAANSNEVPISLSSANAFMGQDVYFLGFPYFGNSIKYKPSEINAGFSFPFIKKATLSAMNDSIIYLDGHNNPGFSGGPIVFWDHVEKKLKVLGIISAYLTHNGEIKAIETSVKQFYLENSGIAIGYDIRHINELLSRIPTS